MFIPSEEIHPRIQAGQMAEIIWTDYMRYRAQLRGFELATIEHSTTRQQINLRLQTGRFEP
jgi:hypothetical protein